MQLIIVFKEINGQDVTDTKDADSSTGRCNLSDAKCLSSSNAKEQDGASTYADTSSAPSSLTLSMLHQPPFY